MHKDTKKQQTDKNTGKIQIKYRRKLIVYTNKQIVYTNFSTGNTLVL